MSATSEERIIDEILMHKHPDYDYWHPKARVHKEGGGNITTYPVQTRWDVSTDDVYGIVYAMSGLQFNYFDSCGEVADIDDADYMIQKWFIRHRFFSESWVCSAANIDGIETEIRSRNWEITSRVFESKFGTVWFVGGTSEFVRGTGETIYDFGEMVLSGCVAQFEEGSLLHRAKLLLESGELSRYCDSSCLGDAMHVLYVLAGGAYYDLAKLPDGGHIPPEILVEEYGVSWETIAKIPLGKPRDHETFVCPICGTRSFFAGVCRECEGNSYVDEDDVGVHFTYDPVEDAKMLQYEIEAYDILHKDRKTKEHELILSMAESGDWSDCRYMVGGE